MAKYSQNVSKFISGIIIICYLSIGFIPNLSAVDKIAPQWLAMTVLNGLSIIFLAYNRIYYSTSILLTLKSIMSIAYIAFIAWASLSYYYAINPIEVIVNITRQANVLLMYLIMGIFLFSFENKIKFICWIIFLISSIEVYAIIVEAQNMIVSNGVISSGELKGVTANRNITAFSLAIKIPFILFLFFVTNKRIYKVILTVLIFLAFLCLSMIQSRASFVGVGVIFVGFLLLNGWLFYKDKKRTHLTRIAFLVVPLLIAILVNQLYLSSRGADAISRAATISLSTNDGSVNQRLRYYEDVLTHMRSNPILGVGLGNWKLKSIEYDAKDIQGYVVPYHAHSDFIQLGAELGILGFLLYLLIFFLAVLFVYRLIRFSSISQNEKIFVFLLLISLGVYSVDANLNFPIARPQVLVVWAVVISLIMGYYQEYFYRKSKVLAYHKLDKAFLLIACFVIVPSLYITNQVFKSLKGQMFLLQDFNSNKYNIPLNQVENIVPDIPNITVTTIPIKSVKARYFFNAQQYDKALSLIDEGISANPYLFYSEILKSQIFEKQEKLDSAKYYARKAFFGLPNNDLHSSRYLNLISKTGDKEALESAFDLLTINNREINWKNYLIIASSFYPPGEDFLVDKANIAKNIFKGNQEFQALYRQVLLGQDKINKAAIFSNNGLEYYNNRDYLNAAKEFKKAIELNPLDYAYYENASTSNYMTGNLYLALDQINRVINDLNPNTGKCEYIKALIFIRLGDPVGACPLLEKSISSGFSQSSQLFEQYCK